MLNERQQKLVSYIQQLERPVTVEQLSSYFSMSERTIRNDIKMVQLWGLSNDIPIHFKNSSIHLDEVALLKLKDLLNVQNSNDLINNSPLTRQLYIVLTLLMSDEYMSLVDLATQYNSSKSTMASDMRTISEWLQQLHIRLVSNKQGYLIEANEFQRRMAMINVLEWLEYSYQSTTPYKSIIWSNLSYKNVQIFTNTYERYINHADNINIQLYCILIVQYERLKHGAKIEPSLKKFVSTNFVKEQMQLLQKIHAFYQDLNIDLDEQERDFLIITLNLFSKQDDYLFIQNKTIIQDYLDQLLAHLGITKLSNEVKSLLKVELNKLLFWKRLKVFHISPLYSAVHEKFRVLFHLIQNFSKELELWAQVPHYMWTEIVLLLAGEMELQQIQGQKLRAILVCPNGNATSYFLEKKLQRYFHNIEIVDKLSVEAVLQKKEKIQYDLIISTVLLQGKIDNVIVIPPILDDKQLVLLRSFIRNIEQEKQKELSDVEAILPTNVIQYKNQANSIEELIKEGYKILKQNEIADEPVLGELLQVYQKFGLYFEILPGVIMPHVISPHVKKAGLSCICLKEPLHIQGKQIQTVITLVSPNETEHVYLLQNLYELVSKTKSGFELNSIIEKRSKNYVS